MTSATANTSSSPPFNLLREAVAPPGWVAYYHDPSEKHVYAFPMVMWVTVEYEQAMQDENDASMRIELVHEIRPFVLTRAGQVIDAQEPLPDFLCLLGPGFDHLDAVRHLLRTRYPEADLDVTLASLN